MSWYHWLALPPLVAACIADVRWRLVPDWASLAMLVLGVAAVITATNPGAALIGGGIGAVVGIAAAIFGLWGWGDAKLFTGASLLAGPAAALPLVAGMAIAGALLALVSLSMRPVARRYAANVPTTLPRWLRNEFRRCRLAPSIPYAVAIAVGVMSSSMFRG